MSGAFPSPSTGAASTITNFVSGYFVCASKIGLSNKKPGVTITFAPPFTARSMAVKQALSDFSEGL